MLGALLISDGGVVVQSSGVMYSTSSSLTIAYNVGAMAGVLYAVQLSSGVIIAMSYVASEDASFSTLDQITTSILAIIYIS